MNDTKLEETTTREFQLAGKSKGLDLVAGLKDPRVDGSAVTWGSMEVEGVTGPDGSPYPAMLVMPLFLWEHYGSPSEIYIRLTTDATWPIELPETNVFLAPDVKGG